jgi:hypothetical protein
MGGSITAITNWLHCADHQVVPLRRSSTGLITAITVRSYSTDHLQSAYSDNKTQADQHVADQISVDKKRLPPDRLEQYKGGARHHPLRSAKTKVVSCLSWGHLSA